MLLSSKISEYLVRSVGFFFNYISKAHPKVPTLGAFSTFFLKKGKKPPNLSKIECIQDPIYIILFFEMGGSLRATQDFHFLLTTDNNEKQIFWKTTDAPVTKSMQAGIGLYPFPNIVMKL